MSEIRINYNLSKKDGLEELNTILGEFSFIGGHTGANSCDVDVLNALGKSDFSAYPNIKRWHKYISSFSPEERKKNGMLVLLQLKVMKHQKKLKKKRLTYLKCLKKKNKLY